MSTREFFAQRLEAEIPAFVNVIRALPADRLDYKPHEKNTSAGDLAWQIAEELRGLAGLMETGEISMGPSAHPSVDEIATAVEREAKRAVESVRNGSDEQWSRAAKFSWAGNAVWEVPADQMAWGFLFDLVHHRGQLSTYLRPMGGKVPSIYGPSGDAS
ncbi:MAG: DinB family protein [Acidobacteriota bacterium]|nr:DinB family protein [Acidobacteriota bacterium]